MAKRLLGVLSVLLLCLLVNAQVTTEPAFIPKDYAGEIIVKFNPAEEKIILYNNVTKKTLESINPDDFLEMINKLDYNSGVLVNKSI